MFEALLGIHRPYMLHTHTHSADVLIFLVVLQEFCAYSWRMG